VRAVVRGQHLAQHRQAHDELVERHAVGQRGLGALKFLGKAIEVGNALQVLLGEREWVRFGILKKNDRK
jgi:hypothetical protein